MNDIKIKRKKKKMHRFDVVPGQSRIFQNHEVYRGEYIKRASLQVRVKFFVIYSKFANTVNPPVEDGSSLG